MADGKVDIRDLHPIKEVMEKLKQIKLKFVPKPNKPGKPEPIPVPDPIPKPVDK